jgi:hypothetical protein
LTAKGILYPATPAGCSIDGSTGPKCQSFGSWTVAVELDMQTGEIYATNAVDGNVVLLGQQRQRYAAGEK